MWRTWSLGRRVLALLFGWVAFSVLMATQTLLMYQAPAEIRFPWAWSALVNLHYCLAWAALTPIVEWLSIRFPPRPGRWGRSLAVHAGAALALAPVQLALYLAIVTPWRRAMGRPADYPTNLQSLLRTDTLHNAAIYGVLLLGFVLLEQRREAREKEIRTVRLEQQLATARLAALRMQLQPHFLFNTLNSIAELMHEDREAAESMVIRLGDLLRQSFESMEESEIALSQELAFVRAYLEIERVRYADRLRICFEIAPGTEGLAVPNFVLQPLVENAVRHGIARRSASGTIVLGARRAAGRLTLAVTNDPPEDATIEAEPLRVGVGLVNTRARLAELYGSAAEVVLERDGMGRFVARIELPAREERAGRREES